MKYEVLHVQMLGRFTAYYGRTPIIFNKAGSAKSLRLFQILLLSGKSGIPKNELIDSLYGWSEQADGGNRNKNLNNLIYRLKGQLVAAGMPECDYVQIRDGICYWNNDIPLDIDAVRFEEFVIQEQQAQGTEKIRLCQKAEAVYFGELLPMNLSDMWFYGKSIYLKELYIRIVRILEKEYRNASNYMALVSLYAHAASIYPFDNWQTEQMRCYLEMYRYEDALNIYNETMEMYAREMGTPPTEEMQECFDRLMLKGDKNHLQEIRDLSGWQTLDRNFLGREGNITKAIFQDDVDQGAYYCTYPSFVDYCRLVVRATERSEVHAVLLFLTLTQYDTKTRQKQGELMDQMDLLKKAVGKSLRRGDAYTRYGNRHFILMMTNIEADACSVIFKRIENAYNRSPNSRGELWYHATMTQDLKNAVSIG